MRKLWVIVIIEIVLWAGAAAMNLVGLASLYNLPVTGAILGVSLLLLLILLLPEVKAWMDPAARIYRRGKARHEKDRESRQKARIRAARKTGILRTIAYDPATDSITGDLIRRSWKSRWVGYGAWLANHHILPPSVFVWLVKRLGYTIREDGQRDAENSTKTPRQN